MKARRHFLLDPVTKNVIFSEKSFFLTNIILWKSYWETFLKCSIFRKSLKSFPISNKANFNRQKNTLIAHENSIERYSNIIQINANLILISKNTYYKLYQQPFICWKMNYLWMKNYGSGSWYEKSTIILLCQCINLSMLWKLLLQIFSLSKLGKFA